MVIGEIVCSYMNLQCTVDTFCSKVYFKGKLYQIFFFLFYSPPEPRLSLQYYNVICRPSDHSACGETPPRAEIRTQTGLVAQRQGHEPLDQYFFSSYLSTKRAVSTYYTAKREPKIQYNLVIKIYLW